MNNSNITLETPKENVHISNEELLSIGDYIKKEISLVVRYILYC